MTKGRMWIAKEFNTFRIKIHDDLKLDPLDLRSARLELSTGGNCHVELI